MVRLAWIAAAVVMMGGSARGDDAAAAASSEAESATLTPEMVVERLLVPGKPVTKEEVDLYAPVVDAAAENDSKDARWQFAKAMLTRWRGQGKDAKTAMKRVVEMEPSNPDYHFWYGTLIFETINDAGMLAKAGLASDGKGEFEKAIELDPAHVEARYALAQFYLRAPGIAGGSIKKAKQQAEALLGIEKGVVWGHVVYGQVAVDDEEWEEMTAQYEKALVVAKGTDQKVMVLAAHAFALLREKKDYAAAMEVAKKLDGVAPADDPTAAFVMGESHKALKEYPRAIEAYLTVLKKRPESRSSRMALAQTYEATGELAKALEHYRIFIEKFPDDDRASDATSKVKKLEKALGIRH